MAPSLPQEDSDLRASAHHVDARSKIIVLAVFSACIFFCDSLLGIGIFAAFLVVAVALQRMQVSKALIAPWPIYIICAIAVAGNAFVIGSQGLEFSEPGFLRGSIYAMRICLIVWASLMVCYSTTSAEVVSAASWILSPLRKVKAPVDDISMVFSIALRFIPEVASEYKDVRDAMWARGATFDEGSVAKRAQAYSGTFIAVVANLFSKANHLGDSMDSRLYGYPGVVRTSLYDSKVRATSAIVVAMLSASFACIAIFL